MERQLTALVERPCKATFLAARAAVLHESPLRLTATDIAELDFLLEHEEHSALLARLDSLPPSKVLSPRVHFLAAEAADGVGDLDEVEVERSLFVLTLQGLLATGDGTQSNPYQVCHSSDEYDILAALGQEPAGQSLIEQDGRLCDVLICKDGREVWFDVSEIVGRAPRQKSVTIQKHRSASRNRPRPARMHG